MHDTTKDPSVSFLMQMSQTDAKFWTTDPNTARTAAMWAQWYWWIRYLDSLKTSYLPSIGFIDRTELTFVTDAGSLNPTARDPFSGVRIRVWDKENRHHFVVLGKSVNLKLYNEIVDATGVTAWVGYPRWQWQ